MKAVTLTTLTAPKNVSFDGTSGPTAQELAELSRWFTPGKVQGGHYLNGKVRWNLPRGDHQIRKPQWSIAEAGMACKGLDERYYFAMRFEFAQDFSVYWDLRVMLLEWSIREKNYRNWPNKLLREGMGEAKYLDDLVRMHLFEVQAPGYFARPDPKMPNKYRELMNVSKHIWNQRMRPIYETIRQEWMRWIEIGNAHMNRRINERT